MKKLLSMILALALVFSFSTTAFAANPDEKGSITINDAEIGHSYSVYRILDLFSSKNADGENPYEQFVYETNEKWEDFVMNAVYDDKDTTETEDDVKFFVVTKITTEGVTNKFVTWNTEIPEEEKESAAKALAELANEYADAHNIEPEAEKNNVESAVVEFEGLELGYYLLDSTAGILCSLDTTDPDVVIEEKNGVPTSGKNVEEDSNKAFGDNNDAAMFQEVVFEAFVNVKAGAQNYAVHDKMSTGLTYLGVTKVEVGTMVEGSFVAETTVEEGDETYTVIDHTEEDVADCTCEYGENCTFTVDFEDAFLADKADKTIRIEYKAKVNENAVIEGEGNPNELFLKYGDENQTEKDETVTFVHEFKLDKVDGSTGKEVAGEMDYTDAERIDGAQFKLFDAEKRGNEIPVVKLADGRYRLAKEGETAVAIETVNGGAEIEGLDSTDVYYVEEIKAPDGYNKLKDRIRIQLADETDSTEKTVEVYTVVNNPGVELPSTGGMGTTMFYLVGGIMTIGALVVLVARKRMGEAE